MKHGISNLFKEKLNQNLNPIARKIEKPKIEHVLQGGPLFFYLKKNSKFVI